MLYFVTGFLGKQSQKFYSQPFTHWPAGVSACQAHAQGRKLTPMSQANHSIAKHGILSDIIAHVKGSGEEIEVMLGTKSDEDVQNNWKKLKLIIDILI